MCGVAPPCSYEQYFGPGTRLTVLGKIQIFPRSPPPALIPGSLEEIGIEPVKSPGGIGNGRQLSTSPFLGELDETGYWVPSISLASQDKVSFFLFSLRYACAGWAVEKKD